MFDYVSILPTSLYTHLIQDMLRLDETTWTPELRDTYKEQTFKGLLCAFSIRWLIKATPFQYMHRSWFCGRL